MTEQPSTPEEFRRGVYERHVAEAAEERTWTVPGYQGKGEITMTLRLPEVTITDDAGRAISISPRQAAVVGTTLDNIDDWLQYSGDITAGDPDD